MGKKISLGNSPTGVQHYVDVDDDAMHTVEFTPTSVESEILDSCAELRSLHQNKGGGFRLAARTPINTHMMWLKEWQENFSDKYTWMQFKVMKLNSADNKNLRTGRKVGGGAMRL